MFASHLLLLLFNCELNLVCDGFDDDVVLYLPVSRIAKSNCGNEKFFDADCIFLICSTDVFFWRCLRIYMCVFLKVSLFMLCK